MGSWCWLVGIGAAVAGCYRPGDLCEGPSCVQPDDATSDGPPGDIALDDVMLPDSPTGAFTIGTPPMDFDFTGPPPPTFAPAVTIIDTDSGDCPDVRQVAGLGNLEVCVFAATAVALGNLQLVGSRPAVIIGVSSVQLNGTLDVSSRSPELLPILGAGHNAAICPNIMAPNDQFEGGAGGSFAGQGGQGGAADQTGELAPAPLAISFHGGCKGGNGGNDTASGGPGGGAVYVISNGLIMVNSAILAGGGGGFGGQELHGGGGGGSGGYIGLDSPNISLNTGTKLIATGGGGGGGGDGNFRGNNGSSPLTTQEIAPGGLGSGTAGDGGSGSDPLTGAEGDPGDGTQSGSGGGGGGGGFIKFFRGTASCDGKCFPNLTP
jgi:hypothetical protein